ncbi:rod-binding protein [Brevundimonas sp.]|uniref:rod-binding protein n=1 Tax=Brevundimonas sp. TaxID=1871086 RepID=UPI001A331122|nr:rod-binding protein [Brevundimonas sp.]MBJ7484380.1 rod-binding protein [Brevundimonas sp.]
MIDPITSSVAAIASTPAQLAQTARMRRTAEDFETSFMSQMMKPMFEGLSTDGMFGGGEAEATWRSFLIDAMAKQAVKAGGIGLTDTVMAEMIKMQEQGR